MNELPEGDCGIGMTQASSSGFILATRVGKHTDQFISELITNTEGKTNCKHWHTDDWEESERVSTHTACISSIKTRLNN